MLGIPKGIIKALEPKYQMTPSCGRVIAAEAG